MPRKRPGRLRPRSTLTAERARELGLPLLAAQALDRLGEPGLVPEAVATELKVWRDLVHLPASTLSQPHNDWTELCERQRVELSGGCGGSSALRTELVGPSAREVLAEAVQALGRRDGAPLRAELARLDAELEHKTSHNPLTDPTLPWWSRRWSH